MKFFSENSSFFGLLSAVWAYLLLLCLLIGLLIVPIDPSHSKFFNIIIGTGKLVISLFFILIWLISWYKSLGYIFERELRMNENISMP